MSLGGKQDMTGHVSTQLLTKIVRDFQLTIDIQALVAETDDDDSG